MQLLQRTLSGCFTALLVLCGSSVRAEQLSAEAELRGLRKDVESLIRGQIELQKQIAEIKTLIQGSQSLSPPPATNINLDLDGIPAKGLVTAPLTIVEFTDYQCPFCAKYTLEVFPEIEREYINTGKLRYFAKDYPLETVHPLARPAAEAALCAGLQSSFWTMRALLFANQSTITTNAFPGFARELSLDLGAFGACRGSGNQSEIVRRAQAEGNRAGVTGTPTFFLGFVNSNTTLVRVERVIVGYEPYGTFKKSLDELLAKSR